MTIFSIIIPVLDPLKSITKLIDNLRSFPEAQEQFDLIIVNNLECYQDLDFHTRYSSSFYRFSYQSIGQASANIARNLGIRYSIGEWICFLDDDCLIDDFEYFNKIKSYYSNYPDTAGLGGPYRLGKNSNIYDQVYHQMAINWLENSVQSIDHKTQNLIGGNCIYRGDILRRGFYFDPTISYGSSELSLNYQLVAHGYVLRYFPDLTVTHSPQLSLIQFLQKAYKQGKGSAKQIFKQPHLIQRQTSWLMWLYNLFFHLGFISHGRSISVPQKLYRFLEFIQFIKLITNIKLRFMRVYWLSLPFWGAVKKYTIWIYWAIYPIYALLKNAMIWLRWSIYPLISWSIGLSSLVGGHLRGLAIKVFFKIRALWGSLKKKCIQFYWFFEPKFKWPFIKLYFMAAYHLKTYVLPVIRKCYPKR